MILEQSTTDQRSTLFRRVFHAGGWTMFGLSLNLATRLGGNLVLTRLLFPEAFGLMVIVQAVLTGVTMLSELGIEQSIIYHRRGDSPAFLNTAWTLNIIRNILLWIPLYLLAPSVARFYGQPMIAQLLPVAGLGGVIAGFGSTNLASADRNLTIAKATLVNIVSNIVGLIGTIFLAWVDHSIWSLVVGSLIGISLRTAGSHLLLDGISNRFSWDRESVRAMASFGRWVFVGSALTFFVGEGNRLLMGALLPVNTLAFLNLAISMVQMPSAIVQAIGGKVFFSAYSELERERPGQLYGVLAKIRLIQIVPHWFISVFFVYFGSTLMDLLYDYRYRDAGWMLQLLGLGWLSGCLITSYGGVLLARGSAHLNTILLASQLLIQISAIYVGYYLGGAQGTVIGLSSVNWILYPVNAYLFCRLSLWQPKIDLPFLALSILIVASILSRFMVQ